MNIINSDNDYDYLLQRAESRLLSARAAYENACREKNEVEKYLNSDLSRNLFLEMARLKAELQQAIGPEVLEARPGTPTLRRENFFAT